MSFSARYVLIISVLVVCIIKVKADAQLISSDVVESQDASNEVDMTDTFKQIGSMWNFEFRNESGWTYTITAVKERLVLCTLTPTRTKIVCYFVCRTPHFDPIIKIVSPFLLGTKNIHYYCD